MADKKTPKPEETPDETPVVEETTPEAPAAEAEPVAETPVEDAAPAEAVAEEAAPAEAVAEEAAPAEAAADEPAAEAEPAAAEESTPEAPAAAEATPEAPAAPPAVSGPKKHRKHLPRSLRHKHSKPKRETGGERKPIVRLPKPESVPGRRQERRGVVVSDKGEKTIVVKVEMIRAHPKYKKVVRRSHKFHAHDEQNAAGVGDIVRIVETRPLSKTKNWRLAEIVEKAR